MPTVLALEESSFAAAIVAIRWGALPRWLGWVTAVTALGLFGGLSATVFAPQPPE